MTMLKTIVDWELYREIWILYKLQILQCVWSPLTFCIEIVGKCIQDHQLKKVSVETDAIDINALIDGSGIVTD